jgi:branched-chain amino acid aminotransferase
VDRAVMVYLNGRLVPDVEAAISIHDAGFLSADGVFETALLHRGGFLRLRQHLDRFSASAATMRLPAPTVEELDRAIRAVVRANALMDANVRITLTRGVTEPTLLITARPVAAGARARARLGWRLITAQTRRPGVASAPAQLKALGRTYALLARHEAADAGVDDALLLAADGSICEGPTWNVFWRTGRTIFTPALDAGVLAGVTRSILLEIAPRLGYAVQEGLWRRAALDDADEIFATMTSVGIVPCRALDGRQLPDSTPAADALLEQYWDVVAGDAAADPLG